MTCNLLQLIRHPISCTAFVLALAGCGYAEQYAAVGIEEKRRANDLYTRTWYAAGCDQSFAGAARVLPEDAQLWLIKNCLGIEVMPVVIEQFVVGSE